MIRRIIAVLILFTAHSVFATEGQSPVSIFSMDAASVKGYMVIAVGNDPTMATGTSSNIACADAIRTFVHDTTGTYAIKAISLTTTGTGAATYNNVTGTFNIPNLSTTALIAPVITDSGLVRALNTPFTLAGKFASVNYSVKITVTIALSAITGQVAIQYTLLGSVHTCPPVTFTPTVALLGLNVGALTSQTVNVTGLIPANATNVTITTTTVTGVAYAYVSGQEGIFN